MRNVKTPRRKTRRDGVTPPAQRRAKRVAAPSEAVTQFKKVLGLPHAEPAPNECGDELFPNLEGLTNMDKGRMLKDMAFVERLYRWYQAGGRTYEDVAKKLGVNERTIYRAFKRRDDMRNETLDALMAERANSHLPADAEPLIGQISALCVALRSMGVAATVTYAPLKKRSRANV